MRISNRETSRRVAIEQKQLTPEDLGFTPPAFLVEKISDILQNAYGLAGTLKKLEGERDQNHLLHTEDGSQYVVKISNHHEDIAVINFQIRALLHIEQLDPGMPVPRPQRTLDGQLTSALTDPAGHSHAVRLVSYLPGIPYNEYSPPLEILKKIGALQGRLCQSLSNFQHRASRHFMPWDISNGLVFNDHLLAEAQPDVRTLVSCFLPRLRSDTYPLLPALRRQVIHNDGHRGNMLRADAHSDNVVGVIDFGDMVEAPLVQDLAVSVASFIRGRPDPLEAIGKIAAGFHSVVPLRESELNILPDLVIMRLTLALLLIDFRLRTSADPPASLIEEQPAIIDALIQFGDIERDAIVARLHHVCEGTEDPKGRLT